MLTVLKREIRSPFSSYKGYLFVALFGIAFGVLRMVYHYLLMDKLTFILHDASSGTSFSLVAFEYMLTYLPFAFAIAAPILTFSIFDTERRMGAWSLLRSLPLTAKGVVFGKYLSALCVFLLSYTVLTVLSFLLGFYTGSELLTVMYSILFYALACNTLLAINFFISAVCKNKYVALGVSYGVNIIFAVLFATRYAVPYVLGGIFEKLSILGTHTSALVGIVDISAIILHLTVGGAFLYLSYVVLKNEMKVFGGACKNEK